MSVQTPSRSSEEGAGHRPRTARDIAAAVLRQPAGAIGTVIILAIVLIAVLAPLIAPYSPTATDPNLVLSGPGGAHPFGTDDAGRDVLSRLIFGARPALMVGTLSVLVGGAVGIGFGVLAGYSRGAVESIVMRISDVVFAFPLVLIGICAVIVLGPGVLSVGLAVGIGVAPMFARLARAEVLREMNRDYVKAARGMGGTPWWIVLRHVMPNIGTTMIVQMATVMSSAIVIASALDFLGLGTQPPAASWGNMLQASRQYLGQSPVFAIAPGVVLTIFVLAVNLFAAALTNALNPRIRTKLLRARGFLARLRGQGRTGGTPALVQAESVTMREAE